MQDEITLYAGAEAFGDGSHPTTQMMLTALEAIDSKAFAPDAVCDMGCGAGLLAIRVAQKFGCTVVAVDIEKSAVEATRENATRNGLVVRPLKYQRPLPNPLPRAGEGTSAARGEGVVTLIHSDGFKHPDIKTHAPYDLILMNILAEPLQRLSVDSVNYLADRGILIMSGVLVWQQDGIIESYQQLGLELAHRLQLGDWVTLVWEHNA